MRDTHAVRAAEQLSVVARFRDAREARRSGSARTQQREIGERAIESFQMTPHVASKAQVAVGEVWRHNNQPLDPATACIVSQKEQMLVLARAGRLAIRS